MSSSYNKNQSNNQAQSLPDPMTMLLLLLSVLGVLWWNKHESKITRWYFGHYEEIYLAIWVVILGLVAFSIWFIKKKTVKISERANLLSPHWKHKLNNISVGETKDKVSLFLSDELRSTHVQIIGTTGRGKTQSIVIPWTLRDLARGKSVILIDGKGSRDVPIEIRQNLEHFPCNVNVFEFDLDKPKSSVSINPLKSGTPQQITDRIFSAFDFDDTYYRGVQYNICGYLIRLISESGEEVTFSGLYELLTDEVKLSDKLKNIKDGGLKKSLLDFLKTPPLERKKNLTGLTSQIAPLAVGEIAKFVNGGDCSVSLEEVLANSSTLFMVSVPTLKYQKMGHQLGKLILQDLAYAIGVREKMEHKHFASVFLDEFSEFAYDGFVSILNKARSAKVAMHLSHQAMSDLSRVSPDFAKSVISNTNVKCILGLNDPETADYFARHLGTFTQVKLTEQTDDDGFFYGGQKKTGRGSMREVESYKVHPNDLKQFTRGAGVLHIPTSRGNITEVIQFKSIGGQH